jgi:hypothetical protein
MAANLFKRKWLPDVNGLDSTTPCTNANTVFMHSYLGDDSTGDGTRENPYKTYGRCNLKSGVSYINFKGVINEFVYTGKPIMGDDINQTVITSDYTTIASLYCLTINTLKSYDYYWSYRNVIIRDVFASNYGINLYNCTVLSPLRGFDSRFIAKNCTINGFEPVLTHNFDYCNSELVIANYLNFITNAEPDLNRCIIPSDTKFKWNGTLIASPAWTADSKANIQLLRNAYLSAGVSQVQVDRFFIKDAFGGETCQIVWEVKDGGVHPNIFNGYNVDGSVKNFTLNSNALNIALHANNTGGLVGSQPAAIALTNWGSIINVNADGSDDVVAGQLLQSDFTFSHASGQTWNRVQSAVKKIEKPGKFKGLNCDTLDGTPWGDYFGKKQNLVSNVALNTTDVLEPNTRYKVSNTADHSNYSIVIYKGVQYPPDFFFVTDDTNLSFELLNEDSGSVVRKVFATPLESGEVIPFDDMTTQSAFPRFSAPFMGNVMMLFHKTGDRINQPVLFSEVDTDKMAYYANWAVTNADQEFVTLAADTENYYYKIPVLTYYQTELNAHFDANYDQ